APLVASTGGGSGSRTTGDRDRRCAASAALRGTRILRRGGRGDSPCARTRPEGLRRSARQPPGRRRECVPAPRLRGGGGARDESAIQREAAPGSVVAQPAGRQPAND